MTNDAETTSGLDRLMREQSATPKKFSKAAADRLSQSKVRK